MKSISRVSCRVSLLLIFALLFSTFLFNDGSEAVFSQSDPSGDNSLKTAAIVAIDAPFQTQQASFAADYQKGDALHFDPDKCMTFAPYLCYTKNSDGKVVDQYNNPVTYVCDLQTGNTIQMYLNDAKKDINSMIITFSTMDEFNKAKNDPQGDLSLSALMLRSLNVSGFVTTVAQAAAEGCTSGYSSSSLPQTVKVKILDNSPTCDFDKGSRGISGTYKRKQYSISYYVGGKRLTSFGGPKDHDLPTTKGSVTHEQMLTVSGLYAAYPLAGDLPSQSKVTLANQSYRGENNAATNEVLNGKCLHICKVATVNGQKKKAELWARIIDRGPQSQLKGKIDVSPEAYQQMYSQLGLRAGANITDIGVQLENCK